MTIAKAQQILPKAVRDGIERTVEPFLYLKANGEGRCSRKTRDERRNFYPLVVAELWELDFKLKKLENLSAKHVEALMHKWDVAGISAGTLHTRLSMLKFLCDRLGKDGVVHGLHTYLPAERTRRSTVARESKAWEDQGVNPLAVIDHARQIDERLAVMLALQHFFALRVKESIEIRPCSSVVENGTVLVLHEGTKGGRPRRVPIITDDQMDVIDWARRVALSGTSKRIRWNKLSWEQAKRRFYHLIHNKLGISKELKGITPHGLRHGYAQRRYRQQSGFPTPIEGGSVGLIDRETHEAACNTVTSDLGHGRRDVTATYYGSLGHALRVPPVTSCKFDFSGLKKGT